MSCYMRQENIAVKHDYARAPVFARAASAHIQGVKNLQRIRRHQKLSQMKLAELAEVTQPTISKLENGDLNPSLETIYAIARALRVEPQELFDLPELMGRALSAIGRMPPEQQEAAVVVLEAMAVPKRPDR